MKLKKSYLRKIIKEELKRLLLELDPMDDDDPEHDASRKGIGESKRRRLRRQQKRRRK